MCVIASTNPLFASKWHPPDLQQTVNYISFATKYVTGEGRSRFLDCKVHALPNEVNLNTVNHLLLVVALFHDFLSPKYMVVYTRI